jgi:TetR/AcrR family transcriptional regulator, lmrAB and yxaGH operons repressor
VKRPIDSRARFVETTAALLRRQGYHATGLAEIVEESGAPKGSLYFHFPGGKEALAAAALERSGQEMQAKLAAIVAAAPGPAAAVRAVTSRLADELEASRFQDGCPMATVTLEAAAQVPALQAVCSASYARWQALIGAYLASAGMPAERARSLANLVLSAVEGALLLSRAHADTAPLHAAGKELERLLAAQLGACAASKPRARPRRSSPASAQEPAQSRATAVQARRGRASR